jgi:hypothetical protein
MSKKVRYPPRYAAWRMRDGFALKGSIDRAGLRVYEITTAGKKQLAAKESRRQASTSAVNRVLRMA